MPLGQGLQGPSSHILWQPCHLSLAMFSKKKKHYINFLLKKTTYTCPKKTKQIHTNEINVDLYMLDPIIHPFLKKINI